MGFDERRARSTRRNGSCKCWHLGNLVQDLGPDALWTDFPHALVHLVQQRATLATSEQILERISAPIKITLCHARGRSGQEAGNEMSGEQPVLSFGFGIGRRPKAKSRMHHG